MLVLSRKTGEAIQVGTEVEVTVVSVRHNRVKLAFDGPKHVRIMRAELLSPDTLPQRPPPARRHGDVAETKAG